MYKKCTIILFAEYDLLSGMTFQILQCHVNDAILCPK